MSKKLALSSALSVALMAAFVLFGQGAAPAHGAAEGGVGMINIWSAAISR